MVQHEEIDKLNTRYPNVKIFKGIESDILPNGDLDYSEEILKTFDFVIVSIHSNFRMGEEEMTNRIVKAMRNPFATMLGHPTGRLLLSREPYELDMDKILRVAAETGVILEINAHPYRLDLDWRVMKKARDLGILFSVNPDAHDIEGFHDCKYGIGTARKGWLGKENILNCGNTETVADIFNRRSKT